MSLRARHRADYDDSLWPCRHCGCPQGEHSTRTETTGFGRWAQTHAVEDCTCGTCDHFEPCDEYEPDTWTQLNDERNDNA